MKSDQKLMMDAEYRSQVACVIIAARQTGKETPYLFRQFRRSMEQLEVIQEGLNEFGDKLPFDRTTVDLQITEAKETLLEMVGTGV